MDKSTTPYLGEATTIALGMCTFRLRAVRHYHATTSLGMK